MSKTRKRRKRVSKKYKGGDEKDKKGVEKIHKKNENMYEEFLKTTEQIAIVKEEFIEFLHENKFIEEFYEELFDAINVFEELEDTIYSFLEKKDVIDKKYVELNRISKLTSLNRNKLQNVIIDLDTVFESFVLDTKKIYNALLQNFNLMNKYKNGYENFVINSKNEEIRALNYKSKYNFNFRIINSIIESLKNIINYKQYLIDNVNNLKDTINSSKFESINTKENKTEMSYINIIFNILQEVSNHNKYDSLYSIEFIIKYLIIFNNSDIDYLYGLYDKYEIQILIKYGYQKETENYDTWINGSSNDLVELKTLVFQNNKNLEKFNTVMDPKFLSLTNEIAGQIKKAEKANKDGEDKNENEVNFLIETYPDALEFFKNPKPQTFTKYTTRITKKRHNPIKRRMRQVDNSMALIKHYKKIKEWGPKKSKKIKATIDEKGEITV